jgi:AraC family transcriptional regulator of adaptative response / DNA-3-methyladenine glycosylase II
MKSLQLIEPTSLLDPALYESARQARDPRYDGRFFVGVLTTGIYCRPVCPVRVPKQENISLYRSAAAASAAGFRPCLRCRPESSPGTPAWSSGPWKVTRALEMIERGYLDNNTLEALAAKLLIGERQLARLFKEHLGATPSEVAQTRRLHFAKKLIDETDLPFTSICFAAGFGSVRRFNAVLRKTYGRTPRELRAMNGVQSRRAEAETSGAIELTLSYRPPFDWRGLLEFLAYRAIPGVERVTQSSYGRSFRLTDGIVVQAEGHFIAQFSELSNSVSLRVWIDNKGALQQVVERVRAILDLRADSDAIETALSADSRLAGLISRFPGTRVPGCWSGFEVALRAILGQQVTVKAASTLVSRLAARHGEQYVCESEGIDYFFPEPEVIASANLDGLGIVHSRVAAILEVARRMKNGELEMGQHVALDSFIRAFCDIRGIGEWTANYVAMRALGDPNAFPHSDLILLRAAADKGERLTPSGLKEKARLWQPWRAYAVLLLWRGYAVDAA